MWSCTDVHVCMLYVMSNRRGFYIITGSGWGWSGGEVYLLSRLFCVMRGKEEKNRERRNCLRAKGIYLVGV